MKRGIVFCILVLTLILILAMSSCIKVEKTETVTDKTADDIGNDVPAANDKTTTTVKTTETAGALPSAVQTLVDKGRTGITNNKYIYRFDPFSQERHGLRIMGNKIKYELPEEQMFFKYDLFDTVYLDMSKKTAVAYCEHRGTYKCPEPNKPFDVDFNEFVAKNDKRFLYTYWYDLLEENSADVEVAETSSQQVFDRNAMGVKLTLNGVPTIILLDRFSGMVLKVTEDYELVNEGDAKTTTYEPEGFGKVRSEDVEHQRISV